MKKYFLGNPLNTNQTETVDLNNSKDNGLRNRSVFKPRISSNHCIETFKGVVLKELETLITRKYVNPEYCTSKKGMSNLERRNYIVVRPADKGEVW